MVKHRINVQGSPSGFEWIDENGTWKWCFADAEEVIFPGAFTIDVLGDMGRFIPTITRDRFTGIIDKREREIFENDLVLDRNYLTLVQYVSNKASFRLVEVASIHYSQDSERWKPEWVRHKPRNHPWSHQIGPVIGMARPLIKVGDIYQEEFENAKKYQIK
jgi:hypothetical protein